MSAPLAITGTASLIEVGTAVLTGQIDPNNYPPTCGTTHYWFEWGVNYGSHTPEATDGAGDAVFPATNLYPSGTYALGTLCPGDLVAAIGTATGVEGYQTQHFRLVAWNNCGTNYGTDMTWPAPPGAPQPPNYLHDAGKGQY